MSTIYQYTGITDSQTGEKVGVGVAASAMTNKSMECAHWDSATSQLDIYFTTALDGADKTILDSIVGAPAALDIPPLWPHIKSPDDTIWEITIDNAGTLVTTAE